MTNTPEPAAGSPDKEPAGPEPATTGQAPRSHRDPEQGEPFLRAFLGNLWSANTVMVTLLAVVLALVIGAILIIVSDPDVLAAYGYFFAAPGQALSDSWAVVSDAYANLLKGSIVDPDVVRGAMDGTNSWEQVFYPISETLTYAVPLVFTGLAVAIAFRGGLFNIGGQGQAILGAIGAGLVGFLLPLPPVLHVLVALLGALLAGALFGYVPGVLKARTGAHEVITTIMLNYVALFFLSWLIVQKGIQDPARSDAISKPIDSNAHLTNFGSTLRANIGVLIAIAVTWAIAWLLNRSTLGFELRAVGGNPDAARTAGMSVGRTYTFVMALSGGLAGLGGSMMVLGTAYNLTVQVVGQIGFNGILVALLGRAKPWGVALGALLFGALQSGGNRMQSYSGISVELVTVLQALIVIFIAAPALVKTIFRLRAARASRLETSMAKGW